MGKPYIGVSGWTFPGWRGKFYPKGLKQKDELAFASEKLTSIEINGTFHSLQRPSSFKSWYQQAPSDFVFSVKGGQYVTHIRRLKDIVGPLTFFFGSGIFELKEKLGPILWQFPPNMILKDDRFERFVKMLPKTIGEARHFAAAQKDRLRYPEQIEEGYDAPLRYAFELRHKSFFNKDFYGLLREHQIALVHAHDSEKAPLTDTLTTDFAYLRMHGEGKAFKKGYTKPLLAPLIKEIKDWLHSKSKAAPRKVFVYFNSDAKVYAPASALTLIGNLSSIKSVAAKKKQSA